MMTRKSFAQERREAVEREYRQVRAKLAAMPVCESTRAGEPGGSDTAGLDADAGRVALEVRAFDLERFLFPGNLLRWVREARRLGVNV